MWPVPMGTGTSVLPSRCPEALLPVSPSWLGVGWHKHAGGAPSPASLAARVALKWAAAASSAGRPCHHAHPLLQHLLITAAYVGRRQPHVDFWASVSSKVVLLKFRSLNKQCIFLRLCVVANTEVLVRSRAHAREVFPPPPRPLPETRVWPGKGGPTQTGSCIVLRPLFGNGGTRCALPSPPLFGDGGMWHAPRHFNVLGDTTCQIPSSTAKWLATIVDVQVEPGSLLLRSTL